MTISLTERERKPIGGMPDRCKVYVNPAVCSRAYLNLYHGLSWFTQTISQSTSQLRVQSHLGIHHFLFILFRNWLKEFALPSWPIRCNQMQSDACQLRLNNSRFRALQAVCLFSFENALTPCDTNLRYDWLLWWLALLNLWQPTSYNDIAPHTAL